ncbi:3-oxoadipate enol-lactonase [Paraburkholderia bonniea]|uniref:bifunctional 3-oxoadipate enol-lactonase/4-carboxymuconolactone decarboxylase PcaDC n=1 Tax=Paraburkholderia bonniea TaxID=2152891 RepID=UPI0012915BB2|nr:3-oxoadipate enol-lactonase [Paraburkholderia bonniea]
MPYLTVNGIQLHYRIDGDSTDAPWLVLSNSLGCDLSMWAPQVSALAQQFRVLRYDTRGHGQSSAPPGPYTIEQLSSDVLGLMDRLGIERAHFCGLSMGGLTGIALAARHAERFERVVLCNTAARIGSPEVWLPRAAKARSEGMAALADAVLSRWFTARFVAHEPLVLAALQDGFVHTSAEGYAANCAALNAADLRADTARITAPVLVLAGTHDLATTPAQGRDLALRIADARYVELDAAHLSNLEQAPLFTRTVLNFLKEQTAMTNDERYEAGLEVRRAVLGEAHVERSLAARTELNHEFQDLITRYAWGEIWTRDGLPRHTRSLLTIAMMVALNRTEELALHLRAAKNNGVTRAEIKEVLLQTAIYCGVPAANSAFHLADKLFAEGAHTGTGL